MFSDGAELTVGEDDVIVEPPDLENLELLFEPDDG